MNLLQQKITILLNHPKLGKLVRFFLVGGFASAVYYCIAVPLDWLEAFPTMAVNTFAYACGFVASYTGQKHWTFRDASSHGKALPRFMLSSGLGLCVNSAVVWLSLQSGIPYYIASFFAIVIAAFFSYFIQRFFVFTNV